jgi:FkbM family methyltransferase
MQNYAIKRENIFFVSKSVEDIFRRERIVLIDGGAAGGLSSPFSSAPDFVQAVRFEPRGKEAVSLDSNDIFIDGGIWSEDTELPLHIANGPSASSICEPNKNYLELFDDRYGWPLRRTVSKPTVKLRSIDSVIHNGEAPKPNFIKLDIHSAELPALQGAINSLDECIGILVESWHSEVHIKQGLHYDIEKLLISKGFDVYDNVCASKWRHQFDNEISLADRPQYIGSEMLFIKREIPASLALKKIMILTLFGFGNAAKKVAENFKIQIETDKANLIIRYISIYQKKQLRSPKRYLTKVMKKVKSLF